VKLIAYDELIAAPWKNGGGVTRELACHPPGASLDAFIWRVSIAEVGQSGPFSTFIGIDRVITLLEGDGMLLQFAHGVSHTLTETLAPYRFRGEDQLDAQLLGSPSRDFNLMLRRDLVRGTVEALYEARTIDASSTEGGTLLLFCASGGWRIAVAGAAQLLQQGDTLLLEDPADIFMTPRHTGSALLSVSIAPLRP
jgi:uncharacterized protein